MSLVSLVSLLTALPTSTLGQVADRSFSKQKTADNLYSDWMSWVPTNILLSQLSIPATHDAMALYGGPITETQSMSILDQLKAGIRAFDIRYSDQDDRWPIYHGDVFQKAYFDDMLKECNEFLEDHGTETIIVKVSTAGSPLPKNTTRLTFQTFQWYRSQSYGTNLWISSGTNPLPRLGEVRGKIVLAHNWETDTECTDCGVRQPNFNLGLNYDADWNLATIFEMNKKWDEIVDHAADVDAGADDVFYTTDLNISSSSGGIYPDFGANGTAFSGQEGMNHRLLGYILEGNVDRTLGLVFMDFPGSSLIGAIISLNMKFAIDIDALRPDFERLVEDVGYGLRSTSNDAECSNVGDQWYPFLENILPDQYWNVVVARGTWGYWVVDEGLFARSDEVENLTSIVWNSQSLDGFYSDSDIEGFVTDQRLKDLSGDSGQRADDLWHQVDAQFPGVRWNTIVKQDPGGFDNWAVYTWNSAYYSSDFVNDGDRDYKAIVWATSVNNAPPDAALAEDNLVSGEGQLIAFDASASYDPDGDPLTYHWDLEGDGETNFTTTSPYVLARLTEQGNYTGVLYVEDGIYSDFVTFHTTITNIPPIIHAGGDELVNLGTTFSRLISIIDPYDDSWTARVSYGGGFMEVPVNPDGTFLLENQIPVPTTNTVTVTVTDGTHTVSASFDIYVVDQGPPTFKSFTCLDATPEEGEVLTFDGRFFHPGYTTNAPLNVNWGDGSSPSDVRHTAVPLGNGIWQFTPQHTYADNASPVGSIYEITLAGPQMAPFTSQLTVANIPPTLPETFEVTTGEGLPLGGQINFMDPGEDEWTLSVNYGDGSAESLIVVTQRSFALSHIYEEVGMYEILVTLSDDEGDLDATSVTALVTNLMPAVDSLALEQPMIPEGDTAVLSGLVLCDGLFEEDVRVIVNWGDGRPPSPAELSETSPQNPKQRQFTASHRFLDNPGTNATPNNTYLITVTAVDRNGSTNSSSILIGVGNVPPVINSGGPNASPANTPLTFHGNFTDPGKDLWTGLVNFGDGTGWNSLEIVNGTFSASHLYPSNGLYTVELEITDDDGASNTGSRTVLVGTPRLKVSENASGDVVLKWMDHEASFRLQRKLILEESPWTNLNPGLWTLENGTNTLTLPADEPESYFQLIWP